MEALTTAQLPPQAAELVQTRWDEAEETSLFSSFLADRPPLRGVFAAELGQGRAAPLGQPHASRGFKLPGGGGAMESVRGSGASRATSAAHRQSPQRGRREQTEVWSGQLPLTPGPLGSLLRFHSREEKRLRFRRDSDPRPFNASNRSPQEEHLSSPPRSLTAAVITAPPAPCFYMSAREREQSGKLEACLKVLDDLRFNSPELPFDLVLNS